MKPLLDKHGVADLLNVSVAWVEKATSARQLPIVPVGRCIRYDPDDIAAWVESRKQAPAAPAGIWPIRRPRRPRPSPPPSAPRPPAGPGPIFPPAGPKRAEGEAA